MAASHNSHLIIQFAKEPRAGKVKTRLASVLSENERNQLHSEMTAWVCKSLHALGPFQLWVSGNPHHKLFKDLQQQFNISLHTQQGNDLGERMAHALQQGLEQFTKVIIVGSDCPFIDANYCQQALHALDDSEVVVGPAHDGGYVLLGLRKFNSNLFSNIEWGGDKVFAATIDKIKNASMTFQALASLADVDRPEDLSLLNNDNLPSSLRGFTQERV